MNRIVTLVVYCALTSLATGDGTRSARQLANIGWFAKGAEVKAAPKKKNGISKRRVSPPANSPAAVPAIAKTTAPTAEHEEWTPQAPPPTKPQPIPVKRKRAPARRRVVKAPMSAIPPPVVSQPPIAQPVASAPRPVPSPMQSAAPVAAETNLARDPFEALHSMDDPFAVMDKTAAKKEPKKLHPAPTVISSPSPPVALVAPAPKVKTENIPERAPSSLHEPVCSCSCLTTATQGGTTSSVGLYRDDQCRFMVWDVRGLTPSSCAEMSGSGYCDLAFQKVAKDCRPTGEMGTLANCVYKVIPVRSD